MIVPGFLHAIPGAFADMVDVTGMQLLHYPCRNLPIASEECVVPPEIERIDRRTALAWAKEISVAEYLQRERFLKTRPFSRGLTIHALVDEASDTILASCETYRVPVHVPGRSTDAYGLGIASVFVDEAQRGHGYAAELLRRLHRHFAEDGAALCYLMSEIGPTLYARLGYVALTLRLRRYPACALPSSTKARWLTTADLPEVLASHHPPMGSPLHIPPSQEQLDWHLARGRYYAQLAGFQFPSEIGARCDDAVAVWKPDFRREMMRLRVLLLAARAPSAAVSEVIVTAQGIAHQLSLPTVEVWESDAQTPLLTGGELHESSDVPMMLPLANDVRATDFHDVQRYHWL